MPERLEPIPLSFWRSASGREPVRDWLNELPRENKRTIGRDIAKVQFGWLAGRAAALPHLERRLVGGALIASEQARGARLLWVSRGDADRAARRYQEGAQGSG
jgi:hypothetical protein